MNVCEDVALLYRVAKYYYVDDYSQKDIAKMTGVSRPQVSRLIKRARERGIVNIQVSLPDDLDIQRLQDELKRSLMLRNVYIIPGKDGKESDKSFFSLAANYLEKILKDYRRIGLGWGYCTYETSRYLSYQTQSQDKFFYPLIGNSGNNKSYLQTSTIVNRFAEHYQGKAYYLNALAFDVRKRQSKNERIQTNDLMEWWNRLDAAVVGIGGSEMSEKIEVNELADDPFLREKKPYIMGDILGGVFLKDQSIIDYPDYYRIIACPLNQLKNFSEVIAITKGLSKVEAINFSAKMGYIKSLITDEQTAKALFEK